MQNEVIKDLNLGWVPIFEEMSKEMLKHKHNRRRLVKILYETFASVGLNKEPFMDREVDSDSVPRVPLQDICPFTFLASMNRKLKKRNEVLQNFCHHLKVDIGDFNFSSLSENGKDTIPMANSQNSWLFPYKYERNKDDIDKLWAMFEVAIKYADNNSTELRKKFVNAYDECINVAWTGNSKLSQALYTIRPRSYPTLDSHSIGYLNNMVSNDSIISQILWTTSKKGKLNQTRYSGDGYLEVTDELRRALSDRYTKEEVFIGLSYDAYSGDRPPKPVPPIKPLPIKPNGIKRENNMEHPLNQILYGPPGTGKTYATTSLAVDIITDKSKNSATSDRSEIRKEYRRLMEAGRIKFVTFHQSYGYEEFVEGIKPELATEENNDADNSSNDISYHIQDGVFKEMCTVAFNGAQENNYNVTDDKTNEISPKDFKSQKIWQIKLGKGNEYKDSCFEKNHIRRGSLYFPYDDLSDEDYNFFDNKKLEFSKGNDVGSMRQFCLDMQENDLVIIYESPDTICALGRISEKGYKLLEEEEHYNHSRAVDWLWIKKSNEYPVNVYTINQNTQLSDPSIYRMHKMIPDQLIKEVQKHISNKNEDRFISSPVEKRESHNNYVIIIDEINRGNISKILGELITLLEDDKRLGRGEELKVTLPYSGDEFGVPDNLYIIGTMNTADRSIAFLDTALRRRFQFTEMMPDTSLLSTDVDGINLQALLERINEKIVKHLDRDHQIGHSHFMGNKAKTIETLANTFRNNICPLLDEYFYDRRETIIDILNGSGLIIGNDKDWKWADNATFINKNNYIAIYNSGV